MEMSTNQETSIMNFVSDQFGEVRATIRNGEPWFVANDVCRALEIANAKDAIKRLDDDEKSGVDLTDPHGRVQRTNVVNEPGLYSLVLGSRKPEARAFKRWITHDVIPSIRKTGGYIAGEEHLSDDELVCRAFLIVKNKLDERERQFKVLAPKAEYYDALADKTLLTNLRDTAKELGLRQNQFIGLLLRDGFVYRDGGGQLKPYAQYAGTLFSVKDSHNPASRWAGTQTLVTMDGKDHFRKRYCLPS